VSIFSSKVPVDAPYIRLEDVRYRKALQGERRVEKVLEKGILAMTIAAPALVAAGAQARAARASDIP